MAEIANPKPFSHLFSISTIDGRFRASTQDISKYFSEYGLMKSRILVEVEWLLELSKVGVIRKLTLSEQTLLQDLYKNFSEKDAQQIWNTDLQINHDVKSHELFVAQKIEKTSLNDIVNYVHFGLTSTDVDNLAFIISLRDLLTTLFYPKLDMLLAELVTMSHVHKATVMLGRTHGVPALPTTAGKEIINFAVDIKNQLALLRDMQLSGKISGAIGNRNELNIAFPQKNWKKITENFIERLGFRAQTHSTQIEQHSNKILIFDIVSQIARICAKLGQDLWIYNSLGYLTWRDASGHVGSSVMPHKINPIGAELAQAYCISGAETFHTIINILMENRLQRDLRDKYILRKTGEAFAEIILGVDGLINSLPQLGFNKDRLEDELNHHWEVLSASIQTILRVEGVENPYDLLKKLSRGNTWTKEEFTEIVDRLPIDASLKKHLVQLSPTTATGEAASLVEDGIVQVNSFLEKK